MDFVDYVDFNNILYLTIDLMSRHSWWIGSRIVRYVSC